MDPWKDQLRGLGPLASCSEARRHPVGAARLLLRPGGVCVWGKSGAVPHSERRSPPQSDVSPGLSDSADKHLVWEAVCLLLVRT